METVIALADHQKYVKVVIKYLAEMKVNFHFKDLCGAQSCDSPAQI